MNQPQSISKIVLGKALCPGTDRLQPASQRAARCGLTGGNLRRQRKSHQHCPRKISTGNRCNRRQLMPQAQTAGPPSALNRPATAAPPSTTGEATRSMSAEADYARAYSDTALRGAITMAPLPPGGRARPGKLPAL